MKRMFLVMMVLVVFSIPVYATSLEFNYSSFTGASMMDFILTTELTENIVVRGTYSSASTLFGGGSKFDIQGGVKMQKESTILLLAGIRKGEHETGLLISGDFKSPYINENTPLFMHTMIDLVIWQDRDVSALFDRFLLGYQIESLALKGGLYWLTSQGQSEYGPTFGIEFEF